MGSKEEVSANLSRKTLKAISLLGADSNSAVVLFERLLEVR